MHTQNYIDHITSFIKIQDLIIWIQPSDIIFNIHYLQVFAALFALVPLAAAIPAHPAPAYGHPAPAYGHPAPAYGHAPAYGYEQPKHNCSVVDVVETAEVCTPTLEKTCVPEVLPIKLIISVEQCYTVTRTVCTESIEVIPNEVCVYEYEQASEQTFEAEGHHSDAKTVEVVFVEVWFNKKNLH